MGLSIDYLDQDKSLLNQTFLVNTTAGPMPVSFADFDQYLKEELTYAIVFGVRIGTATIVSILLTLMSRKYKSPVFWLNQTSLILLIIHSSLFVSYLLGPFVNISTAFTGSFASITFDAMSSSVATSWVQLLLVISIECSLLFQTRAVFPERGNYKNILTGIVFCIATLPTIVIWTFYVVLVSISTVYPERINIVVINNRWVSYAIWPIFAASVVFYSSIFSIKLFLAIRRRRKLGLKQFDTTQIIFIMSVQTMFIPSIFTILQFALPSVPPGYSAFTPLLVVLFLPLSAMWASFNITTTLNSSGYVPFARSESPIHTDREKKRTIRDEAPASPSTINNPIRTPSNTRFAGDDDDDEDMFSYNEIIRSANKEATRSRFNV